jgi:anti-sigma B factor antagonist
MINIEKRGSIDIVTFNINKINALIAEELKDQIVKVFENPHAKAVLDLTGVEYIDSSGFGCLLTSLKTAKNNYGVLKITNAEPSVMALFETLYLHTVFEIYNDTDSCIKSFR